jgi:hypothetical protein
VVELFVELTMVVGGNKSSVNPNKYICHGKVRANGMAERN